MCYNKRNLFQFPAKSEPEAMESESSQKRNIIFFILLHFFGEKSKKELKLLKRCVIISLKPLLREKRKVAS